jgi:hypothetical protein
MTYHFIIINYMIKKNNEKEFKFENNESFRYLLSATDMTFKERLLLFYKSYYHIIVINYHSKKNIIKTITLQNISHTR